MVSSPLSPDDSTVAGVRAVTAVLVVSGLGLGAGVALVLALSVLLVGVGLDPSPLALLVISLVSIQGVAFGGVALLYLRFRGRPVTSVGVRLPSVRELLIVVAGYAMAFIAAITGAIVIGITGAPAGELSLIHL